MITFIPDLPVLGYLPTFFSEGDSRPARDQLHANYAHGGGVHPFTGFELVRWERLGLAVLRYPGDPPMRELARAQLRNETLIFFEAEWLAIVQPDGSHLICRVN